MCVTLQGILYSVLKLDNEWLQRFCQTCSACLFSLEAVEGTRCDVSVLQVSLLSTVCFLIRISDIWIYGILFVCCVSKCPYGLFVHFVLCNLLF